MSEPINAGNVPPAPSPVVCARCGGAIEPGLERCPTCGAPQSRALASGVAGAGLIGALVGGLGLFFAVAWVWPDLFRHVGLGRLADWLAASGGRRLWMMLPMWMAFMAGHVIRRGRTRAMTREAWMPFAGATGGRVETVPSRLDAGAWTGGLEVRARGQRWLLTLDTERQSSAETTRLRAAVTPRRDFHLTIMPQSRFLKAITSPRIGGFLLALGRNAAAGTPQDAAQRHAVDEISFVLGPAIELGDPEFDHAFLIKSDDEGAARALLAALRAPLIALRRPGAWWQLTLASSVADGRGLLEYRESGVVRDAARLEAVQQAMTRMLERLASDGVIAEAGPASNT